MKKGFVEKLLLVFVAMILTVSISGCRGKRDFKKWNKDKKDIKKTAVPVKVEKLKIGDISSFILSSSTIQAEYSVDVVVETSGIVEKIFYDEGDNVKKGDVLAVVNYEELKLTKDKKYMAYLDAKKKFERTKNLFEKKLVSKEDYDKAEFTLKQSEIDYKDAKVKFDKSMIKAPFDGVITERYITLGQYVSPSQKAFSIVNTKILKAIVYIPEENVSKLKKGQRVVLESDTINKDFEGKVEKISSVVDPESGTVKVTVRVKPDKDIRPGMFVNVKIITDTKHNVLLVPKKAVIYQNDRKYIFVVDRDTKKVKKVELKTGYENKDYFECLNKGFSEKTLVVVAGQNTLKDGDKVRVIGNEK
ncbi:efflux RND transporter periplasmic adaptor subunit [Thermotomaculum hydrothermale]|uniref:efflux RND transporter periplasmic adaptor subunit n=1 Tax=Thermotomaculum hydrothermale TaxID=981385 RepID=UPI001916A72B|nr:efflux RND transporter periplasmic adaptor subunit [Thermotomaculum hydrothermale]